jgi:ribbon-helix-helix CopG family protein
MKVAIHLRLPQELLAAVDARAKSLGWSRTALVERALEAALGAAAVPPPAAVGKEGNASESGSAARRANDSSIRTHAPSAPALHRAPSKQDLDAVRQQRLNEARELARRR